MRAGPEKKYKQCLQMWAMPPLEAYDCCVQEYFDPLPVNRKYGSWSQGGWPIMRHLKDGRNRDHEQLSGQITAPSDIEVRRSN